MKTLILQGKSVFLDNWNLLIDKDTGEKLVKITELWNIKAKKIYSKNIYFVVSDNAANMTEMVKLTGILHLTRNSNTAQLLAKDML